MQNVNHIYTILWYNLFSHVGYYQEMKYMKLSKHQKETIRKIFLGEIYDITSYLKYFNLGTQVKFDKDSIEDSFDKDNLPKKYYYYSSVKRKPSNMLTEAEYLQKLQNGELDPSHYTECTLRLSYNTGIKQETWEGQKFTLSFYEGVYIANSFSDILEFLMIWQFLKSEMLILEVPQDFSPKVLGLFYTKTALYRDDSMPIENRIKNIDYKDFTYDDQYYLNSNYTLSHEHCLMCKEYLDKRICPSTRLGLFIKKRFKTYEEETQNKALFVAWLAIFVSIALTFLPHLHKEENPNLDAITQDIQDIENSIDSSDLYEDITKKLDSIIEKLNEIDSKLSSNRLQDTTTPLSESN